MAEPSKKRKGSSSRSQQHSKAQDIPIPSSISSSSLFSSEEQRIRYTNLFSSHSITDPKFIDMDFFSDESFECIQAFQNSNLIPFMSLKLPVYSELEKAFCRNLPFGGRATRGFTGASSMGGRCAESPPTFIRGKHQKNWKAMVYEL